MTFKKVRSLLTMIDNEAEFYDILRHKQVGIQVKIGREKLFDGYGGL